MRNKGNMDRNTQRIDPEAEDKIKAAKQIPASTYNRVTPLKVYTVPAASGNSIKRWGIATACVIVILLSISAYRYFRMQFNAEKESQYATIIKDVQPLIEQHNKEKNYLSETLLEGECFVWDMDKGIHASSLTDALDIKKSDGKFTAVMIKTREEIVGYYFAKDKSAPGALFGPEFYQHSGQTPGEARAAKQVYIDVRIAHWPGKKIVREFSAVIFAPPNEIKVDVQYGLPQLVIPQREALLATWIENFKLEILADNMHEMMKKRHAELMPADAASPRSRAVPPTRPLKEGEEWNGKFIRKQSSPNSLPPDVYQPGAQREE
jgi:hypothetical protein